MEAAWNGNWRFECEKGVISPKGDQVRVQFTGKKAEIAPPAQVEHTTQDYLLHAFYQVLMEGRKPATACQDNTKSLEMVFDTVNSFESGERVWCLRHHREGDQE